MIRPPPRSTRTDTLFPYTTLFRSAHPLVGGICRRAALGGLRLAAGLQPVEEVGHRHPPHASQMEQAAGEDAVGAAPVLLDLLEGHATRPGQGFLPAPPGKSSEERSVGTDCAST